MGIFDKLVGKKVKEKKPENEKQKETEPLKLKIGRLLRDLSVIKEEQLKDYKKWITAITTQPSLFSGSTSEVIEFATEMVQQTENYILSCEGVTHVKKGFMLTGRPDTAILEIQYDQYWDDGSSAIYSEFILRTGEDQFEVFGSEKSAARMAAVWGSRNDNEYGQQRAKEASEKIKKTRSETTDEPDKKPQVKCSRCGVPLLTETEVKYKYSQQQMVVVGTMDYLSQIERDRNASGVTCAVCGRSFCSACMLKYGRTHPKSGGRACLECGGHMMQFRG